ncbi:hypothetical protein [Kitasatospora sp. NPDC058046]|uniref:hypothetical protein n=1 Tax=Kitasatospora sp. NPDC058046 TaxID=3346312 RepID=UPI0036D9E2A5
MDSMNPNVTPSDVISMSRAAGTLRTLVKQLDQEQSHAIVIGEEGMPQAVLVSFIGFQRLLEAAGTADAVMVMDRLDCAPQAGEGLSNAALERLVAAAGDDADSETAAEGARSFERGPDAGGGS